MLNEKAIRRAIRKQAKILSDSGERDHKAFLLAMDKDRKIFPSRDDLIPYIARHTGRTIPYRRVCPDHHAPAEFIDHMMFEEADVLALACRSGSKTMQFGFASGMDGYHKKLSTRVLGGSGDQSTRVYEEFEHFMNCGFEERVVGEIQQKVTEFEGYANVRLLMASKTSVRGPHVPRLDMDEIDEMKKKIYNSAMSILQSHEGRRARLAQASTRHNPFGLMAQEYDRFHGKTLIWCVFEIMAACPSKRECSTCNVASYCPGWKIMKDGVGYFTLDDAQAQRDRIKDDEMYEADALCRKPRTEGQIYPRWEKRLHMPGRVARNMKVPMYRIFDYGTDHPTVLGYCQIVKVNGRWQGRRIDEMRWRGKAPSVIVKQMLIYEKMAGYNWIDDTLVPTDAAGFKAELEANGISTNYPDMSKEDGVGTVRNLLVPDVNGTVGFIMDNRGAYWGPGKPRTHDTFQEMENYHRKGGIIQKIKDDGPDMIRYFAHTAPELRTDPGVIFRSLGDITG